MHEILVNLESNQPTSQRKQRLKSLLQYLCRKQTQILTAKSLHERLVCMKKKAENNCALFEEGTEVEELQKLLIIFLVRLHMK